MATPPFTHEQLAWLKDKLPLTVTICRETTGETIEGSSPSPSLRPSGEPHRRSELHAEPTSGFSPSSVAATGSHILGSIGNFEEPGDGLVD